MRIVFAGSPEFAATSLRALVAHPECDIVAVVTQPDRPAGRGRHLRSPAVKSEALAVGLPVQQPDSVNDPVVVDALRALAPDFLVVVAYGALLSDAVIALPRIDSINVHASLLPRWRGAAPIQRALMAGDPQTGISIMRVVSALDAGPVYAAANLAIGPGDTGETLHDQLAELGATLLADSLPRIASGSLVATPQDEAAVTYAAKIKDADRWLDWNQPAETLARQVRALAPRPGARARLFDTDMKVLAAAPLADGTGPSPGTVARLRGDGLDIATASGTLRILTLQEPGRRAMPVEEFLRGHPDLGQQYP